MLIRNVRLPGGSRLVDVGVRDGMIASIGEAGSTADPASWGTANPASSSTAALTGGSDAPTAAGHVIETPAELDGGGRVLIPGLWDEHVHFGQWAQQEGRLDLGAAESWDDAAPLIAARLAGAPAELVAMRTRGASWPAPPTLAELDGISPEIPLLLIGLDLHSAWLNSAALERYGFDIAGGAQVAEHDCFELVRHLDRIDEAALDAATRRAGDRAAARGVVGIVDLEMRWSIDDWTRRSALAPLPQRVEFGIYPQHLERAVEAGLRSGDTVDAAGLVRVGPCKIISDGSLGTLSALCCAPYPDAADAEHPHGVALFPSEQIVDMTRRAHGAGIGVAIHAIGDRACTLALDAFEAAGCGGRIEHAQLLREEDLPRFARLGVTASVQPEHAMDDRDLVGRYWPGSEHRAYALRSLHRAGARLAFGSDAPVATLDPWFAISAAVTRSRDGRDPWVPEEGLDARAALESSTRGRVVPAVGEVADLAIVDHDPLSCDPALLRTMPVFATLLGGRLTHLASSPEGLGIHRPSPSEHPLRSAQG